MESASVARWAVCHYPFARQSRRTTGSSGFAVEMYVDAERGRYFHVYWRQGCWCERRCWGEVGELSLISLVESGARIDDMEDVDCADCRAGAVLKRVGPSLD
jgi:hypothetical protein